MPGTLFHELFKYGMVYMFLGEFTGFAVYDTHEQQIKDNKTVFLRRRPVFLQLHYNCDAFRC